MKIKLTLLVAMLIPLLIGCVVHPSHKAAKANPNKVSAKTLLRLDHEHQGKSIVIINKRPEKVRNCWSHQSHWHCNR